MKTNKTNSRVNALTETPKTISPLTEEKEENSAKEEKEVNKEYWLDLIEEYFAYHRNKLRRETGDQIKKTFPPLHWWNLNIDEAFLNDYTNSSTEKEQKEASWYMYLIVRHLVENDENWSMFEYMMKKNKFGWDVARIEAILNYIKELVDTQRISGDITATTPKEVWENLAKLEILKERNENS